MTNRLFSLFLCLELLACASWFAGAQQTEFGLNIVYIKVGEDSSAGPLPAIRLSRRERYSQMTQYREWDIVQIYTGNCSQEYQTIILRSTISFGTPIEHYQLRIELSPADPTHCITIDCADGSVGNSILQRWKTGTFWCNTNATILCPSNDTTIFHSKLFNISGEPSPFEPCDFPLGTDSSNSVPSMLCSGNTTSFTCPTDPPTPTSPSQGSLMPTMMPTMMPSPTPMNCPQDGIWKRAPRCSIAKAPSSSLKLSCTLENDTRVCHCDGNWGPVHCTPSVQLARELISISQAEESLKVFVEVLQSSINSTQRLNLLMSAYLEQRSTSEITVTFVKIILDIIEDVPIESAPEPTLLSILDMVALDLKSNVTITSVNGLIVLRVREVFPGNGRVLGIQVDNNYISLPGELFENLNESVFVASFYYANISHVLPGRDQISPVISSILSCTGCRTSNLTENVTVLFDLPPRMTNNGRTECLFADLRQGVGPDFWNTSGCRTVHYVNGSVMCSCNHLTHFAILLSPGVEIPTVRRNILTVIEQVLLPISLVFLLATVLVFVLQKSLWNMRNYIHCMLCASLFAAQLTFVVGVERTENKAVCSAIAVLLHYLYLVVFMWMLMEGVVLYLVLVKVFVKHNTRRYIAAFTVASYGIPLVYMALVVPLGFLVNTDNIGNHYGQYNTTSGEVLACWLRYDTHFIWAFIAPVILIITVNIGFLIMAIVVMCRLAKEKEAKKSIVTKSKYWLKQVITLVVVMGIAWIGNVLFFNVNLIFVAYIMTIFIAGQGIIIFILFVPLSKQVTDAYKKWWKKHIKLQLSNSATLSESLHTKRTLPSNKNSKDGNAIELEPASLKKSEENLKDEKVDTLKVPVTATNTASFKEEIA